MTPYQRAKSDKKPYVKIRLDYRTTGESEAWMEFEAPLSKEEADRVAKLISSLCDEDSLGSVLVPGGYGA